MEASAYVSHAVPYLIDQAAAPGLQSHQQDVVALINATSPTPHRRRHIADDRSRENLHVQVGRVMRQSPWSRAELMQEFEVDGRWADPELPASYNEAPTQTSAVGVDLHQDRFDAGWRRAGGSLRAAASSMGSG